MENVSMQKALVALCNAVEDLRKYPVIENMRDHIEDQIIVNLIAEYRNGHHVAGFQLINHATLLVERMICRGLGENNDVFIAEVAIDEAIAAERAEIRKHYENR